MVWPDPLRSVRWTGHRGPVRCPEDVSLIVVGHNLRGLCDRLWVGSKHERRSSQKPSVVAHNVADHATWRRSGAAQLAGHGEATAPRPPLGIATYMALAAVDSPALGRLTDGAEGHLPVTARQPPAPLPRPEHAPPVAVTPTRSICASARSVEVVAKGLPDHFGDRDAFRFGAPSETVLQLWVEPDRLDR